MTNDLISRSAQHKHLLGPCVAKYPSSFTMGLLAAARELDAAPAVDALEVVRCGECERRNKSADLTDTVYCPWLKLQMEKTDFCSYGKRRNDE